MRCCLICDNYRHSFKTRLNVKFPFYLKKAGLASRNIVHVQKTFYVASVYACILFQGRVAIKKNVSYFAVNALQSRHNIKSLFESSGKSGMLSSHAVFCSMKRLLIEHHMVTPPPPPIVLIHCFYKECYLIDLMVR